MKFEYILSSDFGLRVFEYTMDQIPIPPGAPVGDKPASQKTLSSVFDFFKKFYKLVKVFWDKYHSKPLFPLASIIVLALVIIGLGILIGGRGKYASVAGPQNVSYAVAGNSVLTINVAKAAYAGSYKGMTLLGPNRKFVVVTMEIKNSGDANSAPLLNEDVRLITPDSSIYPPASWSKDFLTSGIPAKTGKTGELIFDVDANNALRSLTEYQIAFGKNIGSRTLYPLK